MPKNTPVTEDTPVVNVPDETEKCEGNAVTCQTLPDDEVYYRQMREHESKDSLALQVLNLANDTHTDELKQLASAYIKTRFS